MLTQEQINIVDEISSGMAILEGLDDAIIGFDIKSRKLVYHYQLILESLIQSGLDEQSATEYIEFNILTLELTNDEGENITPIIFGEYPFPEEEG
jgi:hypothetical protein